IDMRNSTARLSLPEITAAGRRYVSNPAAFAAFVAGLRLGPEILAEPEWRFAAGAAARFAFFRTLMHAECRASMTSVTWRGSAAASHSVSRERGATANSRSSP
ncbi:hypothetical protein CTI14_17415, partial [Methylobacterium radiotolerans]